MAGKPRWLAGQADIIFQPSSFCQRTHLKKKNMLANGSRYPLVGGTRERHFAGTNFEPRKRLENAATPRLPLHALLDRTP